MLQRYFRSRGVTTTDIDDLVQDCLLVAWMRRAQIQPGKEERFLFATAKRRLKAHRRKIATQRARELILGDGIADWFDKSPPRADHRAREAELAELAEKLGQAIDQLPRQMKNVIQLIYIEGLTRAETARKLEVTRHAVHKSERRALALLRQAIEEADEHPEDAQMPGAPL